VARNAFGITPARREFERTAAENRIAEYQSRGGATARTPERVAESAARGEYRQAVRRGDKAAAAAIEKQGTLTKGQIHAAQQEAKETFLERGFKQLPIDQALEVYEVAESDERAKLWPVLYNKATRLIPQASEDRRPDLQRRWKAVQKLPRARQTGVTIH
jgi:Cdc6-like AAA superfamily ATPase